MSSGMVGCVEVQQRPVRAGLLQYGFLDVCLPFDEVPLCRLPLMSFDAGHERLILQAILPLE
jgi:hypothetical protein